MLKDKEKKRYDRQLIIPNWGEKTQKKIKNTTVFIAGCGGLGSAVASYLTAAGIGCLRICDADRVDMSKLNSKIHHSEKYLGKKKVISAKEKLSKLNSDIKIINIDEKIEENNIENLVGSAKIIVDCMDNFETRYILNKYCVKKRKPFIHGAVDGMSGQITFIYSEETPCLKCIFPSTPSMKTVPVLGATAGLIGCLEAQEVLKYIAGRGTLLKNRLLFWDGEKADFEEILIEKNPICPVCNRSK